MAKFLVTGSFRFGGKAFYAGKKQQTLPGDAAKFAVDNGLAIDPAVEKEKAENNKNLGNAPEDK